MHRIYEWIKVLWREKVNLFFKGATSGWLLSGILLFGSNLSDKTAFLLAYIIKVFAVTVSGIISGFATVAGSDMYKWAKEKYITRKQIKSKRKNNESKTKIKRAS
jgi:hypothetical protein